MPQMAEKTSPDAPPNCTVAPLSNCRLCQVFYTGRGLFIVFRGKSGGIIQARSEMKSASDEQ